MGQLTQRHILVAISGGIAAYKGAELVRLLKKQGAFVRVVLSRGATEFITPAHHAGIVWRAHPYRTPQRGG
jgi:phosphopantothenoylcysteine decarboxylase/phosphopantothenate--cysteine ligase